MLNPGKIFPIITAFILLISIVPVQAKEEINEKAIAAANDWLVLIDKDQYTESWRKAANFF